MDIEFCALHHRYENGTHALRGIDLKIPCGHQVAVIGANGCGKSTLARQLNGLLKPSQGQIMIGGEDCCDHSTAQLAQRVAYLFQNPDRQLSQATVLDELAFGPKQLGYGSEKVKQQVRWALHWMELEAIQTLNPFDLPLHLRRRVALASTLAMDTPIMVLDEPCSGQDPAFKRRLSDLLEELATQGKTVLCICHDLEWACQQFAHCLMLEQGKVAYFGEFRALLQQPERLQPLQLPPISALAQQLGLSSSIHCADQLLEQLQPAA